MHQDIPQQPLVLQFWVLWLVIVNTAAIAFIRRVEARWCLVAWVLAVILMQMMYQVFGYARILGVAHIAVWAPLIVYLWMRRGSWHHLHRWSDRYLAVLFASNTVSLAFDYADLVRYLGRRM